MAVFYVLGCAVLLVMHWRTVPHTVSLIVSLGASPARRRSAASSAPA